MLTIIILLFSLVIVAQVTTFLKDESGQGEIVMDQHGGISLHDMLEASYGSVGLTMLHLFMCVTGGSDWSDYYFPLEPTGVINSMLFLLFVAFTQIALLNIILGIFVDSAMKNIEADKEETAEKHAEEQQNMANDLRALCYEMDGNGDGKLSTVEWRHAIKKPKVKKYLEMMNFRVSEVKEFLDHMCLDATEDTIHIDLFVDSMMRFRGSSSCFDMQMVLQALNELKDLHNNTLKHK